MCNFLSGIVTYKNKKVLYDLDDDSHEFLIKTHKLDDTRDVPNFVRVELIPADSNICNMDLANWNLTVDQDIIPDWFDEKAAEAAMKDALQKVWTERFIIGGEHGDIINRRIRVISGAKIKSLRNSQVGEMWENSQVGVMWENSQVGVMRKNSTIKVYSEFVTAKDIRGNAMIITYCGNTVEIITSNPKTTIRVSGGF